MSKYDKLKSLVNLILSDPREAVNAEIYNLYNVDFKKDKTVLHFDDSSPLINLLPHYEKDEDFITYDGIEDVEIVIDLEAE